MKSKKITRQKILEFLKQHADAKMTLDIGCGDKYYDNLFPNKISLDIDKERKPDVIASVYNLPFPDNKFDNVLCTEVFEHLLFPEQAIKEIKRVLRAGGKLILTTRFIYPIHDSPNDYFRYTKYALRELFKGWKIEVLEEETGSFEAIAVILQRLIFQAKYKNNFFIKFLLLFFIKIFLFLQRFIKIEFGDIKQLKIDKNILSSGYYLVAKNIK